MTQSWLDAEMLRTIFLQPSLPFIRKRGSSFVLFSFFPLFQKLCWISPCYFKCKFCRYLWTFAFPISGWQPRQPAGKQGGCENGWAQSSGWSTSPQLLHWSRQSLIDLRPDLAHDWIFYVFRANAVHSTWSKTEYSRFFSSQSISCSSRIKI